MNKIVHSNKQLQSIHIFLCFFQYLRLNYNINTNKLYCYAKNMSRLRRTYCGARR